MSKQNSELSDWAKKGYAEVDGKLVPVKSLVAKKVDKIVIDLNPTMVKDFKGITIVDGNKKTFYPNTLIEVPERYLNPQPQVTVKIKPLSVNDVWQGRRFKTPKYTKYALAVSLLLPNNLIIPEGLLRVYYEFGLSSNGGDWDNPVKPFQDILQEKYKFNDSRIMEATVKKIIVSKGNEYISFKIESL